MRLAQRAGLQKAGDAAAARHIRLLHVDRAGRQHAAKIIERVAVLAGGDVHAGGRALAQQPQAVEIVGGDRLLEPGDAVLGEGRPSASACFAR